MVRRQEKWERRRCLNPQDWKAREGDSGFFFLGGGGYARCFSHPAVHGHFPLPMFGGFNFFLIILLHCKWMNKGLKYERLYVEQLKKIGFTAAG